MREAPAQEARADVRQWLFRMAVIVEVVLVFVEPVLAGSLLSGHYEMLVAHRYGGFAAFGVAVVMTVLAFLLRNARGQRRWIAWVSLVVALIEAGQINLGYQRVLYVHIPLGVALAAALVLLLIWAWSPVQGRRT